MPMTTEPDDRYMDAQVEAWKHLTAREDEVLRLVGRGLTNGEIAGHLGIAAKTVDTHLHHVRTKLGLRRERELVRAAVLREIGGER